MEIRRGRLGRRIEFFTHPKYGGKVPIFLDGTGTFSAVIGDVILTAKGLAEARALATETLKSSHQLEWIPVIEIGFGWSDWDNDENTDANSTNREVSLKFERYWIAKKIDGKWIKASWDVTHYPGPRRKKVVEVGDRLERARNFDLTSYDSISGRNKPIDFALPHTTKSEDRNKKPTYYVAYEEGLWKALIELSRRLNELQFGIVQLLGSSEKRAELATQMQKLLPEATSGNR